MSATIKNVKVENLRREGYTDLRDWCRKHKNVYIGCEGATVVKNPTTGVKERYPRTRSKWANPYKVGVKGQFGCRDRKSVMMCYSVYIQWKMAEDPDYYNITELKHKNLGCWCAPERCHGDVLKAILDTLDTYGEGCVFGDAC